MNTLGRSLVVLAGGSSRRLGQQKTLVEIGDRAVILRILDATSEISEVVVAVRETWRHLLVLEADGWQRMVDSGAPATETVVLGRGGRTVRLVADPEPDLGPLAGLVSGLANVSGRLVLVVAGDLPFMTAEFVEEILDILGHDLELDAVVPFVSGRAQPLCAAYRAEVREPATKFLESSLATDQPPAMAGLLEQLSVRYVGSDALSGQGDLARLTRGINTPEDLEWAHRESELLGA